MAQEKLSLYDLDLAELESLFAEWGQPRYRAKQVWEWLYHHLVSRIDEMTTLPKPLRSQLEDMLQLPTPRVLAQQEALDGETRKDLLEFEDGAQVEVVLMRYIDRRSACVSTQVGCAVGCQFCATGQMGLQRNLTAGEIVVQVLHLARELGRQDQRLTNVVLMGMGEPLLNYDATLKAIRRLIDSDGFRMGQRRITISTAGIAPGIRKLAGEGLEVNLAISLHAATDALRSELMPINRRYELNELFAAIQDYLAKTNRRVTFEWVMISGVNDTIEQAEALAARLSGVLAQVNLIPLNPTSGFEGQPSTPEQIEAFEHVLDRRHIAHTVRLKRGTDIQAGCGQLRRREAAGS